MTKVNTIVSDTQLKIFSIIEIQDAGELIQSIIPSAKSENLEEYHSAYPEFVNPKGEMISVVQSFLIKHQGTNILIDTCNGNNKNRVDMSKWGNLNTDFIKTLEKYTATKVNEIDYVINTHLHFDHIGWNTIYQNKIWTPTFPNAKYLFNKSEYEYWTINPTNEIQDDLSGIEDSILPVVNSGQHELVHDNHQINKNIYLLPLPGHTKSHIGVVIDSPSDNKKYLISGDLIYHPIQIINPEWTAESDKDPDQVLETRMSIFKKIAEEKIILLGSHFEHPVIIESNGSKYKFELYK